MRERARAVNMAAHRGVSRMLDALRKAGWLWSAAREDVREKARWCYGSTATRAQIKALLTDGTSAMLLYRLAQGARAAGLVPLELAIARLNGALNACVIGRGADFGPGLVIVHADGVVINGQVRGGSRVHLEHQVTIGNGGEAGAEGSPVLGDDVYVGAGAKVIGPVAVGDGARVGANAVVVRDVEAHTTVVGVPARAVRRRGVRTAPSAEDAETKPQA